jgi:MFS family permease
MLKMQSNISITRVGYIIGPILGSMLYDHLGYRYAYRGVSLVLILMSFVTRKFLMKHLMHKNHEDGEFAIELEYQDPLVNSNCDNMQIEQSLKARHETPKNSDFECEKMEAQQERNYNDSMKSKSYPTTVNLLRHTKITCAAMTILWISASWSFLEPILAKRLLTFNLGKREIGVMFALSNLVYVPTAFCIQYVPMRYIEKHTIIAISIILTPIGVLLVGVNSLSMLTLGILFMGFFPTPVWIMLLPSMQEDASTLFSNQDQKRCVNDLTAGIYNLFITLGQIVGYIIGPLVNQSYGVETTTRIVAGFIFVQLIVYCFGVGMCNRNARWQRKGRRKGKYFAWHVL